MSDWNLILFIKTCRWIDELTPHHWFPNSLLQVYFHVVCAVIRGFQCIKNLHKNKPFTESWWIWKISSFLSTFPIIEKCYVYCQINSHQFSLSLSHFSACLYLPQHSGSVPKLSELLYSLLPTYSCLLMFTFKASDEIV